MSRQAILPLCYFPPVSWLAAATQFDTAILDVHQAYRKQRYTSRAHIRVANKVMALSVPVERRSKRAPIMEKKPVYQQDWQGNHLRSIQFAYRASPWFEFYEDRLIGFFEKRYDSLLELNMASTVFLAKTMQLQTKFSISEASLAADNLEHDFRTDFDPGRKEWPSWFGDQVYTQVFDGFEKDLSGLDLLFNLGPEAGLYLREVFLKKM